MVTDLNKFYKSDKLDKLLQEGSLIINNALKRIYQYVIKFVQMYHNFLHLRGLLEKYPTFGREKETGLLGALDT